MEQRSDSSGRCFCYYCIIDFSCISYIIIGMKKYIIRTIKIISFCLTVACALWFLQNFVLCHIDHNKLRIDGFYLEDKNSIDVVFTGASELYTGFSPGLAYEEYGFTSYPYATASVTAGASITQVKEIVRTQNPKLIVIEINPFLYPDDRNDTNEGSIRKYIDPVPLNENKIEYIKGLATEDEAEYYFPLIKYHSSWSEYPGGVKFLGALIGQHFRGYTLLKGYKSNTGTCEPDDSYLNKKLAEDNSESELYKNSEEQLRELLSFLNENEIHNVVFFRAPHLVRQNDYDGFCKSNRAGRIIEEYGFDFINFERDPYTMDYPPEWYYNVQHLNVYGSEDFTKYFGHILKERYHIQDTVLTEIQKAHWNEAVAYYHQFYRCCDDKIRSGKVMEINEDMVGMREIAKYE